MPSPSAPISNPRSHHRTFISPATKQCQGELLKRFWANLHVASAESYILNGFGDGRGLGLAPEAQKIAPTRGGYSSCSSFEDLVSYPMAL